jgi:hypothetical protein
VYQVSGNRPVNDAQHLTHRLWVGGEQVSQRKGETDDPLAQWHVGKYFIGQQGRGLGHPAGAAAGAKSALLTRKRHKPLEVTLIAAYAQEPVFEASAFEICFKFSMDVCWQAFAFGFEFFNQGGVVFLYKLVEQSLLRAVAFICDVTKGILTWRKHSASTPTFAVSKSHTVE